MKTIIASQFVTLLANTAAETIGLHIFTPVRMYKDNNPLYGRDVRKVTIGTYNFGGSYQDRVNEAAETSEFVSQPLRWGEWELVGKVITNKGKRYLRYYEPVESPKVFYTVDGRIATATEVTLIETYKYKKSAPKTQKAVGLTDQNYVATQNVSFENIFSVTVDGTEYNLILE